MMSRPGGFRGGGGFPVGSEGSIRKVPFRRLAANSILRPTEAPISSEPEAAPPTDYPADLRLAFQVHALVAGLVGAQHLVLPRLWTDLAGMAIQETVTWRLIGAALLAMAVSSVLAAGERTWERVRILVILEVIWSALAAVVITWGILAEGLPPLEWVNAVTVAGFAVAFAWGYRAARKPHQAG